MKLLQNIVVRLNFPPFSDVFRSIYRLGIDTLISSLAKEPGIHSIHGYGSFFEGKCLYGVSDVDFVILIHEKFTRSDGVHRAIALTYHRLRRYFPFLADWHETVENVIFLSELRAGFPLAESIRLRFNQGTLHRLYGEPLPPDLGAGAATTDHVVSEIDTLLRIILMKREIYTANLLFWKKLFLKLINVVEILGFQDLDREIRSLPALQFLKEEDRNLYFRRSDRRLLFETFFNAAMRILDQVRGIEAAVELAYQNHSSNDSHFSVSSKPSPAINRICEIPGIQMNGGMPPTLYGIMPRMNYLPMDQATPLLHMEHVDYEKLRKISKLLATHGEISEGIFIRASNFFFLMRKLYTHTDVVPLDPLIFSNLYAEPSNGQKRFEMPATIYKERKAAAERVFRALANVYKKNDGRIPKLPFPCIYAEDDLLVLRDALHRMRVYVAYQDGYDFGDTADLIEFVANKHPLCAEFLCELLKYYRHLTHQNTDSISSNYLYRSLLQFMSKLLNGETNIQIENCPQRLTITVGIITRNRADYLPDLLESLTRQSRPADEVLIVNNGSTDQTKSVIESFMSRLPIHYIFLEQPNIPKARNTVIENAKSEIISFTDDDCIAEPGWLNSVERGFLRADNIGIVGGWVQHEPSRQGSIVDEYFQRYHSNTT